MQKFISQEIKNRVKIALSSLKESKAIEKNVINLENKGLMAEALVVTHGTSNTHMQSIATKLEEHLKKANIEFISEGKSSNTWVLVDCGDVVIHIFSEDSRGVYALEELWTK
ncbi:MAG: ribosome silencing factor [Proteobacteria bacterium]|nr:ribosome silencing factor [Pseudomonadota bacterium]